MKTKDLLELNVAHIMLLKHKGLNRTTAYRAHRNSAALQSQAEAQRAAFTATIETAKKELNGAMTADEEMKLQQDTWRETMDEEVGEVLTLRKLQVNGIPWEEVEPEVSAALIRNDLIEGEMAEDPPKESK